MLTCQPPERPRCSSAAFLAFATKLVASESVFRPLLMSGGIIESDRDKKVTTGSVPMRKSREYRQAAKAKPGDDPR